MQGRFARAHESRTEQTDGANDVTRREVLGGGRVTACGGGMCTRSLASGLAGPMAGERASKAEPAPPARGLLASELRRAPLHVRSMSRHGGRRAQDLGLGGLKLLLGQGADVLELGQRLELRHPSNVEKPECHLSDSSTTVKAQFFGHEK